MANEEWETASESSDVLEKRDIKDGRDKRDTKKSFSSQRPQNDRQNRRVSSEQRGKNYTNDHPKNFLKERTPNSSLTKNGYTAPPKNTSSGGKRPPPNSNKKENTSNQVYRLDEVVINDQMAINDAFTTSLNEK